MHRGALALVVGLTGHARELWYKGGLGWRADST